MWAYGRTLLCGFAVDAGLADSIERMCASAWGTLFVAPCFLIVWALTRYRVVMFVEG